MNPSATTIHNHPHPYTFEKAREAVITIKTLRPTLSATERETLALLLDSNAMETVEKSLEEAEAGMFEPLEDAVGR
ncbi:hypothetical protein HYW17_01280 [Candidatus Uhrbacteria bacterium]|nr:hypothetical protein [Candidatus Uhrbacteria bacterium]